MATSNTTSSKMKNLRKILDNNSKQYYWTMLQSNFEQWDMTMASDGDIDVEKWLSK
jgi:hypothetical protein